MKFVRILFLILGIAFGTALTILLFIDPIKDNPDLIMPAWAAYTLLILIDIFFLFLIVYNIICLVKGIDVFFWLIFRHERYVNGEYKKDYNPYSKSSPKPSQKSNQKQKGNDDDKSKHEYGWYEIYEIVIKTSRWQIGFTNAYLEVKDASVKEVSDNTYEIKVSFNATGSITIRDKSDLSSFERNLNSAKEGLRKRIEERLEPDSLKYRFRYKVVPISCSKDGLKISSN